MGSEKHPKLKYIMRIIFMSMAFFGVADHLLKQNLSGFVNAISYFTILSNIMCFLVLLYAVIRRNKVGRKFNIVYGGALLSITLTFFVYNFVLANTDFTMRAMQYVKVDEGDIFVHYLVPFVMWIDFVWIMPHRVFEKDYIVKWLIIPIMYFIMIMGKAEGLNYYNVSMAFKRYPYDFLNYDVNGIPYLVSFIGLFTLLCIGIGLVICMLDFVCGMFYTKNVVRKTIK